MAKTLLRFSASNHPISWLVQQRSGCRFSHVDFLVGDRLLGALPGGGVQWRFALPKLETRSAYFEVPVKDGWRYAETMVGKSYDYIAVALLGLPFPRQWTDDNRWFCSELVAASLLHAKMPIVNPDSWGVTPRDLLLSPLITKVNYV